MKVKYVILSSISVEKLQEMVNQHLEWGFKLLGSPYVSDSADGTLHLQAMLHIGEESNQ